MAKVTPWKEGNITPLHIGWYEVLDHNKVYRDWWDGSQWCASPTGEVFPPNLQTEFQWRGLSKKSIK